MNDTRRQMMQRLNTESRTLQQIEDDEQAEYLRKWLEDHPNDSNFATWACVAVMVIALSMGAARAMLREDAPAEQPQVVNQYLRADYCMTCHYGRTEPVIKNLKQYKKAHPLSQKRILEDLKAAL